MSVRTSLLCNRGIILRAQTNQYKHYLPEFVHKNHEYEKYIVAERELEGFRSCFKMYKEYIFG